MIAPLGRRPQGSLPGSADKGIVIIGRHAAPVVHRHRIHRLDSGHHSPYQIAHELRTVNRSAIGNSSGRNRPHETYTDGRSPWNGERPSTTNFPEEQQKSSRILDDLGVLGGGNEYGRKPSDERHRRDQNRLDIVDLVSEDVKLKKSGRSYTVLHSNTRNRHSSSGPSPDLECFGACNTGGDIFPM